MPTSNHGAIVTPAGSAAVTPPTYLLTMSQSLEPGVVGYYADTTARDAGTLALRTAGRKGMRAFVLGSPGPDWCGWDGTEWVWDHPAPVFHQPAAVGPSHGSGGGFTNTSQANWATADASITVTRRGFCYVGFDYDIETGAAGGWGLANVAVRVDGAYVTDGIRTLAVEQVGGGATGGSRRIDSGQVRVPVMLTTGSHALKLDVWKTSGTGSWRMVSFAWKVTQV